MTSVLVGTAHFLDGSLGWAIVSLLVGGQNRTFAPGHPVRPPVACRNQALLKVLQPQIAELKRRHEKNPEKMFSALKALYQQHDFSPFDAKVLLPTLVQVPVGLMLYRSVRRGLGSGGAFLWMKNLAAPDLGITLLVTVLAFCAAWIAPSSGAQGFQHTLMVFVQVAITVMVVSKLASGIALYYGAASSAVSIGQSLWLRRFPEE